MRSSGNIKKGLAVSAISALAVTGVPILAGTAHAVPVSEQVDEVTLLSQGITEASDAGASQFPNTISFVNDGQNTTASLVAAAPEAVTSITFQYRVDAGDAWTTIGTVQGRNDQGVFTTEFARPDGLASDAVLQIRAVPNTGVENAAVDTSVPVEPADGWAIELGDGQLGGTDGELGIYRNPLTGDGNVAVRGTTSDPAANSVVVFDTLQTLNSNDATPASVTLDAVEGEDGISRFEGVLTYAGNDYDYSAGTQPNQTALTAAVGNTEDTEGVSYYVQSVASVTATPARTNVPTGGTTSATVTVVDDRGEPVAGATIGYLFDDDTTDDTAATDNPSQGTTDANGQVTLTGLETGTYTVYADTNGTVGHQAADVEAQPFTIGTFEPQLEEVTIEADPERTAYDFDELDETEFTVTAEDQEGGGIAGEPIQYRWVVDPAGAGENLDTDWTDAGNTDANGEVTVPFETNPVAYGTAELPAGTYTLEARRPNVEGSGLTNATPISFQAAESEITFDEGNSVNAPVNGTYTVTGNLALVAAGGAGLAGRTVTITQDADGDVAFVPTDEQPEGTTVSGTTATATTDANGDFSVTLRDPAIPPNVEPTPESTDVTAVASALVGDVGQNDTLPINDDADSEDTITVNFQEAATVGRIDVAIDELFAGEAAPGKPVDLDITVYADDDDDDPTNDQVLGDQPVTVSVDKGFLSPNAETVDDLTLDDDQDAEGDLFGFYEELGQSQQISTGDDAEAGIVAAIERDEDFDDDGLSEVTITITSGGVTETRTVTFDSRNYLNVGDLRFERAEGESEGGVPVGSEVGFHLYLEDQFGNLVGEQLADISDDTAQADVETDGDFGQTQTDFTTSGVGIIATAEAETVQTLMAQLVNPNDAALVGADGDVTFDDRSVSASSDPINWLSVADMSATISSSTGGDRVPVGTTVAETVRVVDSEGNPVQGVQVQFTQDGPRTESGSDTAITDANGEAVYVFQGESAGPATVTAVIGEGEDVITVTDTVRFRKIVPNLALKGKNNGGKADRLKAKTIRALEGTTVKLFKKRRNGKWRLVATDDVNRWGNAKFRVRDRNGNRRTTYKAIIVKTDMSTRARSNNRRIR